MKEFIGKLKEDLSVRAAIANALMIDQTEYVCEMMLLDGRNASAIVDWNVEAMSDECAAMLFIASEIPQLGSVRPIELVRMASYIASDNHTMLTDLMSSKDSNFPVNTEIGKKITRYRDQKFINEKLLDFVSKTKPEGPSTNYDEAVESIEAVIEEFLNSMVMEYGISPVESAGYIAKCMITSSIGPRVCENFLTLPGGAGASLLPPFKDIEMVEGLGRSIINALRDNPNS